MTKKTDSALKLERIAAQIADDEPVHWHALDNLSEDDSDLRKLRRIESLVRGFRQMHFNPDRLASPAYQFRFGSLEVLEQIGAGSEGEVFRAYDPLLDLHVALKLRKVDSGTLASHFLEEARRLARIRHANIVSVYGAGMHEGRVGLWTELIHGTTLADLLDQHGPFPVEEVRGIGLDLCAALAAAHRHGLVHGDVKLKNVMREVSGRVVLADFGATRELATAHAGVVSGTLPYLSPEVLRGAAPSQASDLYALGVVLFRLLTGSYPYVATTMNDLLRLQDMGDRKRLAALNPEVPKELAQVIERALAPDPASRHSTALAFAAALAPTSAPGRVPRSAWRVAAVIAGLSVASLALGIYSVIHRNAVEVPAWQASADFFRVEQRGDVALATGATVTLDDQLALRFQSNKPAFVYVFDDNDAGEVAVLFPLAGSQPQNPLASNTTYDLPGAMNGTRINWQVSSDAERERFVVVAADTPLPQLDSAIVDWKHAAPTSPIPLRGASRIVPAPIQTETSSASLRAVLAEARSGTRQPAYAPLGVFVSARRALTRRKTIAVRQLRSVPIAGGQEAGPVKRMRTFAASSTFGQHGQLSMRDCVGGIQVLLEVGPVERFHPVRGWTVGHFPQAHHDRTGAGQTKRTAQSENAFTRDDLADSGVTRGEYYPPRALQWHCHHLFTGKYAIDVVLAK